MTRAGEKKLHEELKHLKEVKRPQVLAALQEARRKGDLSENAEYDAAKEEKNFVETRIQQVETILRSTRIIDDLDISDDRAYIGARVDLEDMETGEKIFYILVSEVEADFSARKISTTSPIGKGILGKGEGDTVEITIPRGTLRYKVTGISR
ncbi:MAG: transcription elongation factor GreA [Candidatus Latescibacteria bacterium]|nr:transcription elongation factor GreA [Candidatus Latescibacterota bacterium]